MRGTVDAVGRGGAAKLCDEQEEEVDWWWWWRPPFRGRRGAGEAWAGKKEEGTRERGGGQIKKAMARGDCPPGQNRSIGVRPSAVAVGARKLTRWPGLSPSRVGVGLLPSWPLSAAGKEREAKATTD